MWIIEAIFHPLSIEPTSLLGLRLLLKQCHVSSWVRFYLSYFFLIKVLGPKYVTRCAAIGVIFFGLKLFA